MLNTDQHNSQVKKRMTKQDFLKNNRGIDEGKDLPTELLESIFDEIQSNEIKMKSEVASEGNIGADNDPRNVLQYFVNTTEIIAQKSEALLKNAPSRKGNNFVFANNYKHLKPIFSLVWMSFLTALSSLLQSSEDVEVLSEALDGFKSCVYIASTFDLELERKAFISTLCKFTSLSHLESIRHKNIEIIQVFLEIVYSNGNSFRDDWKDIVLCLNNLEKLQSASQNNNAMGFLDSDNTKLSKEFLDKKTNRNSVFLMEASCSANSQAMTVLVDRIFTGSANLSGPSIVAFVSALCEMSWEEVSNTTTGVQPRMYCLQRLIEMSFYNMNRIRLEWVNLWHKLGEHFIQVCTIPNAAVGFFALDKLRQLAMKFLDLEELSNFKFQKDFLRPFEEILVKSMDPKIKDMVLACIQQMVQAKSKKFRSGWKAIFAALSKSSQEIVGKSININ
jgi:brefeldin A-inhibited guanine nucleotide-exchange protein